jgi:HAD superfamily hydrolase (TIGR01509 family)
MIITAVIFDLNGTILDDEDEYGNAFNKVLGKLGVDSKTEYPHTSGIGVKENWKNFINKFDIKTKKTIEQLSKETQDAYLEQLYRLEARPGFFDFVEDLKSSGLKVGLATSNNWETMDKILNAIGADDVFDSITTTEEVKFNKPDPDIFITAADKMDVERKECLVIEDSPAGVIAAHEAGMKVIAIARNEEYADKLRGADLVIEVYSEITPKVLKELAEK